MNSQGNLTIVQNGPSNAVGDPEPVIEPAEAVHRDDSTASTADNDDSASEGEVFQSWLWSVFNC